MFEEKCVARGTCRVMGRTHSWGTEYYVEYCKGRTWFAGMSFNSWERLRHFLFFTKYFKSKEEACKFAQENEKRLQGIEIRKKAQRERDRPFEVKC